MSKSTLIILGVIALGILLIAWRQRSRGSEIGPVLPPLDPIQRSFQMADANTKAIEENTAAIRDLIRKLDEKK